MRAGDRRQAGHPPSRADVRPLRPEGIALAVFCVLALPACGGEQPPAFCQSVDDAQASFPGKSAQQQHAYFSTLADVAPPELRSHLNGMARMIDKPRRFRRIAWDRHEGTVQNWITTHCEG